MNKNTILQWAGVDASKIDFALPNEFSKELNRFNVDAPANFVWSYEDSTFGYPRSLGSLLIEGIHNGNLVPLDTVKDALKLAFQGEKSLDEIVQLIKNAAQSV